MKKNAQKLKSKSLATTFKIYSSDKTRLCLMIAGGVAILKVKDVQQ